MLGRLRGTTRRIAIWVGAPILVGLMGFGLESGLVRRQWAIWRGVAPVLDSPSTIDLGEQERGQIVTSRFTIANRGRQELLIRRPRTNCSCAGLEEERDGKFFRLDGLTLKGGEEAHLLLRVRVNGRPGQPMSTKLTFDTNDPTSPEFSILAQVPNVRGGVSALPTCALFSDVLQGATEKQVINIWDDAVEPRRIDKVASSHPDQFGVRLLAPKPEARLEADPANGRIIGRVEVVLQTKLPARINGVVQIFLCDEKRPPLAIAVLATVRPVVQVTPPSVVLPRRSNDGPVSFAACVCRTAENEALDLEVVQTPPGLYVRLEPSELFAGAKNIIIESKPRKNNDPGPINLHRIQLRASTAGRLTDIDLPVRVLGEESG